MHARISRELGPTIMDRVQRDHLRCFINEIWYVFLMPYVLAWCLFLAGSLHFISMPTKLNPSRCRGSDIKESNYRNWCLITSSLTGCSCLALSLSSIAWINSITSSILSATVGIFNTALLTYCLLRTWAAISDWNFKENETMDAHMIGAVYTRLHLSQAYGLMFLGGFCSGLFWGMSLVARMCLHALQSKAMLITVLLYWVNFVMLYSHLIKCHNEIVDTPMWLVWLRGGGLIAAVIYSSAVVYLTLGWRGWQNMLMCGLMVIVCGVACLIGREMGMTSQSRTNVDLNEIQKFSIFLFASSSTVYLVWIVIQSVWPSVETQENTGPKNTIIYIRTALTHIARPLCINVFLRIN